MYSAKILMEAEILARDIMMIDFLSTSEKKEKYLKPSDSYFP